MATSDVAQVAARVLTSQGHEDEIYVLTGPEPLSYVDVAARVSGVLARQVDYQEMPVQLARDQMLASGLSPWQAEGTVELFDWTRQGGADAVTSWVRDLTGDDARAIEDWLSEMRGAFLAPPQDLLPPTF